MKINSVMYKVLDEQHVSMITCANAYYFMKGRTRTKSFNNGKAAVEALKSFLGDSLQKNEVLSTLVEQMEEYSNKIWLPEVYRLGRQKRKNIKRIGDEPMCLYEACEIILQDIYQDYLYVRGMSPKMPDINPVKYYENTWHYTPRKVMACENLGTLDELVSFIVEEIFPYTMDGEISFEKYFDPDQTSDVSWSVIEDTYGEAGRVLENRYFKIQ